MNTRPLILVTGSTGNTGSGLVPALLARRRPRAGAGPLSRQGRRAPAAGRRSRDRRPRPGRCGGRSCRRRRPDLPVPLQRPRAGESRPQPDRGCTPRRAAAHCVYHSASGSERSRIIRHIAEVEAELRASGLPWTILRPTFYLQNTMMAIPTVSSQGAIYLPMKQGRMAMTDVRDIVDVAAHLLLKGGHEGRTYTLTTPESFTIAEFAAALGTQPQQAGPVRGCPDQRRPRVDGGDGNGSMGRRRLHGTVRGVCGQLGRQDVERHGDDSRPAGAWPSAVRRRVRGRVRGAAVSHA